MILYIFCMRRVGANNWKKFNLHLPDSTNTAIIGFAQSGRGAVRLARLHGVQEAGGSNPLAPTAVRKTVLPEGRFYFFTIQFIQVPGLNE